MQLIDAATTRRHLAFGPLIDALRAMFVAGCEVPARGVHRIDGAAGGGTLLVMPAWRAGARLGLKTVTIFPANGTRGLPGLHSTYLLFDAATGVPLAQLDGNEITSRRTAAAAALAASYLARRDAHRLLILGTGRVAALLADALRTVRPIASVEVWNHRPASAHALAAGLRAAGIEARATEDLAAAVARADIVSCATLSSAALVHGAWLRPGTHLDLVGAFKPDMRESDDACVLRSSVFVDTRAGALKEGGDIVQPLRSGLLKESDIRAELAELTGGLHRGRVSSDEITLFKSVGAALEDLAGAVLAYRQSEGGTTG